MRLGFLNISARKTVLPVIRALTSSAQRKVMSSAALLALIFFIRRRMTRRSTSQVVVPPLPQKKNDVSSRQTRGQVDGKFLRRLARLVKIAIPGWRSKEVLELVSLTALLVVRTYLSIALASVNGRIVKAIVSRDFPLFLRRLLDLAFFAVPASTVNSGLEYLTSKLAVDFRENVSKALNEKYLNGMIYYQMTNLDSRITNPDQRFTQDLDKWATCISNLYSNLTKPILDIYLFSVKLSALVGIEGPLIIIGWYLASGLVIRFISPSFGKLTVIEQRESLDRQRRPLPSPAHLHSNSQRRDLVLPRGEMGRTAR
jgi:ATP-binding cassette subfamily D (ALD) protein 3